MDQEHSAKRAKTSQEEVPPKAINVVYTLSTDTVLDKLAVRVTGDFAAALPTDRAVVATLAWPLWDTKERAKLDQPDQVAKPDTWKKRSWTRFQSFNATARFYACLHFALESWLMNKRDFENPNESPPHDFDTPEEEFEDAAERQDIRQGLTNDLTKKIKAEEDWQVINPEAVPFAEPTIFVVLTRDC